MLDRICEPDEADADEQQPGQDGQSRRGALPGADDLRNDREIATDSHDVCHRIDGVPALLAGQHSVD